VPEAGDGIAVNDGEVEPLGLVAAELTLQTVLRLRPGREHHQT
jgi:hypothetical protein